MKKLLLVFSFLLLPLLSIAQNRIELKGTVADGENEGPIPGVNIIEKGTAHGVFTDFNGKFSIDVPKNATLVISYIGFAKEEIKVSEIKSKNLNNLKIRLQPKASGLDKVVVVGYGKQNKVTVTGAISSISTEDLTSSPSASVANGLAGKLPGISSVQFSGQPGDDSAQLFLRGVGTLSSGNASPLVMVDGVERDFTQIDPENIATVSILKDASATAVYGIRGANGVILVTTKRGKKGPAKISAKVSYGLQQPVQLPEFADSYTYATVFNEAQRSDGIPEDQLKFSPEVIEAFKTGDQPILYPDTDWMDYVIRSKAPQTQASFNVSGGTDRVKYYMAVSYLNQEGIFKTFGTGTNENFNYRRFNYRSNIDIDVTNTSKLSFTLGGRSEIRNHPNTQQSLDQLFRFLYRSTPFGSPGIVDGRYIKDNEEYIPGNFDDGLEYYYGRGSINNVRTIYNFDATFRQDLKAITKGLKFRVKGSYNRTSSQTKRRATTPATYTAYYTRDFDNSLPADDKSLVFPQTSRGGNLGYSESYGKGRSWYLESALTYDRRFGDHEVGGLLLYNQRSKYYPKGGYSYLPRGYVGSAARVTYNYKRKYLLEADFGYNGSENFARDQRYGFFPAYSAGWVVSKENFMKNNGVIDYLKLRGSYGKVGSDRQGNNRFLYLPDSYKRGAGYNFGVDVPSNLPGYVESKLGNPNVTWETATKQNYGIDLKLLDNQLQINADYFIDKRDNVLTTRNTVPDFVAATLPAVNIGKVENKGYEINLNWKQKLGNFTYWLNPNITYAKNKIIFMDEVPKEEDYLYRTGKVVGQPFGYTSGGFFSKDDFDADGNLKDSFPDYGGIALKPGDAIYKDINGDGVIDELDQGPIGYPEYPRYTFGLNAGFQYKNLDLRMSWVGAKDVSRTLEGELRTPFGATADNGLLNYWVKERWTPETAETATLPRISFTNRIHNVGQKTSTLYQRDASYIRLKTAEIGYNLSSPFFERIGLDHIRLYLNGYDLLTFDKLDGIIDPETKTGDRPTHPALKIYNIGLRFNF